MPGAERAAGAGGTPGCAVDLAADFTTAAWRVMQTGRERAAAGPRCWTGRRAPDARPEDITALGGRLSALNACRWRGRKGSTASGATTCRRRLSPAFIGAPADVSTFGLRSIAPM
ncbi:hypothetical protein LNP74_22065 [Klebsiella pneumoniae subsp. pneumoniae]|nr:hypothetical protein [Klebsiella pneumoniae subsp. pneumoniae]